MVDGCFIGTDARGDSSFPANNANGITTQVFCRVGGPSPADRNVVSGNAGDGIVAVAGIDMRGALIENNYVGTNSAGTAAISNMGVGVHASGTGNAINADVISGNDGGGIQIVTGPASVAADDLIGTDAYGINPVPSGTAGVIVDAYEGAVSTSVIAFNRGPGVLISVGERFVPISQNSIFGNAGPGIQVNSVPGSFTQSSPVLTYAASGIGGTFIAGTLGSAPSYIFTVEFFSNPAADPSGYGQGQTYLGNATVHTDSSGNATFSFHSDKLVPPGQFVSATATVSPVFFGFREPTSEFSADVKVGLLGDINGDGTVDASDLAILRANFGHPGTPAQGDLDGNGTIDSMDL